MGFGSVEVSGSSRVPLPPERMTAFIVPFLSGMGMVLVCTLLGK